MPRANNQPKVVWHTLAVSNRDPHAFAAELKAAMQEMSDGGYNIVNQMARGEAIIITGSRVTAPEDPEALIRSLAPTRQLHARPQPPQALPPPVPGGVAGHEVLYNFLADGEQKQQVFPDLVAALRLVREHLDYAGDYFVPISVTTVSTTRFALKDLPPLLRAYQDALKNKPLE